MNMNMQIHQPSFPQSPPTLSEQSATESPSSSITINMLTDHPSHQLNSTTKYQTFSLNPTTSQKPSQQIYQQQFIQTSSNSSLNSMLLPSHETQQQHLFESQTNHSDKIRSNNMCIEEQEQVDEGEDGEEKRLRALVIRDQQRVCGIANLHYWMTNNDPIFMLWGCCVLDLRLPRNLKEDRVSGWNNFFGLSQVRQFDDHSLEFYTYNTVRPRADFTPIIQLLRSISSEFFKQLSDIVETYQLVATHHIKCVEKAKQFFAQNFHDFLRLLSTRQMEFDILREATIAAKKSQGLPLIAITISMDYQTEQTTFKGKHISKEFFELVGISQREYQQILLRKGGLDFMGVLDQAKQVQCLLEMSLQNKNYSEFPVTIQTYDNFEIQAIMCCQVYSVFDPLNVFIGDNFLVTQQFRISEFDRKQLLMKRTKLLEMQAKNPSQEDSTTDFRYLIQTEAIMNKFNMRPEKILKKMKKLKENEQIPTIPTRIP